MKMILKQVFHRDLVGLVQRRSANHISDVSLLFPNGAGHTEISGHVDQQVEELRFERDSGRALLIRSDDRAWFERRQWQGEHTLDDRIFAIRMNIEARWERSAARSGHE